MTGRSSARAAFGRLDTSPPAPSAPAATCGQPPPAAETTGPAFGTVAGVPLAHRPRKTTINLTLAEEDELEGLIRTLRRRVGRTVSKDETWRALVVWAVQHADSVAGDLAALLADHR